MLAVAPGPMHPSLGNLDTTESSAVSMLMPALVRTPDRHEPRPNRTPILKPSTNSDLQVAELQGCANTPGRRSMTFYFISISVCIVL